MIYYIFLSIVLNNGQVFTKDPTLAFQQEIVNTIDKNISSPPEFGNTCFIHNVLIRTKIDSHSNIISINCSDGSSKWLKKEIETFVAKKKFNISKLTAIAKKNGWKNQEFLFSYILFSHSVCDKASLSEIAPENYYIFDNKYLNGRSIWGRVERHHYLASYNN